MKIQEMTVENKRNVGEAGEQSAVQRDSTKLQAVGSSAVGRQAIGK